MDNMLTIGQISSKYNISARSIRHYEKLGILNSYRDNDSNYRFYGESESQKLYQIILLKGMGFSLKEISLILDKKVSKTDITEIIQLRLIDLDRKASVYQYCKEMLTKLIDACNLADGNYVDSHLLLNQVMGLENGKDILNKVTGELLYNQIELSKIRDVDLDFLKDYKYNGIYCLNKWTIIMEQDDVDRLLYLLNTVSNKDFWNLFVPAKINFIEYLRRQDDWTLSVSQIYNLGLKAKNLPLKSSVKITYRDILSDLCSKLDIHFVDNCETIEIEKNLIISIFINTIIRYDNIGTITSEGLGTVADILELNKNFITREIIITSINKTLKNNNQKLLKMITMIIDAECRHIYTGTGNNHFEEIEALKHELSQFTRVLDWSIKELWYYLNYLGQSYTMLMSTVLRIAYMRLNMFCNE